MDKNILEENLKRVFFEVNEAKVKFRKISDDIQIMAVTKTIDAADVNIAVDFGVTHLGENKVQEYLSKKDLYNKKADVQFIGHLQSNKVKYIIDSVSVIQSVDSLRLLAEIDKEAAKMQKIQEILFEVNIGEETSKSGFKKDELENILLESAKYSNIRVKGLMSIPPKENIEKYFFEMGELFVDIRSKNMDNNISVLSMGMSADYQIAIKYGSNLIRIGSAIFGARK